MYGAGYKEALLSNKPGSSGRTMKSVMKALGARPFKLMVLELTLGIIEQRYDQGSHTLSDAQTVFGF